MRDACVFPAPSRVDHGNDSVRDSGLAVVRGLFNEYPIGMEVRGSAVSAAVALTMVVTAGCSSEETRSTGPAFSAPVFVDPEKGGAEPVLAIAPDGTLYINGIHREAPDGPAESVLWRSTDRGATWVEVTPEPAPAWQRTQDAHVAVAADGALYYANAHAVGISADSPFLVNVYRSDDAGRTWTGLPVVLPADRLHRMWLVTERSRTVHLAVEEVPPEVGLWYTRSDDRGTTWRDAILVDGAVGFGSNLAHDSLSGTLYVARLDRAEGWYLRVSTDGGETWAKRPMFRNAYPEGSSWRALAVDGGGAVHFATAEGVGGRAQVLLASSLDGGRTWIGPRTVAPSSGPQMLPWLAAGEPGRVALAWYERESAGPPTEGMWRLQVALVDDAGTDRAWVRVSRVLNEAVHDGPICASGPGCAPGERRLLDFAGVAWGPDDTVHVAYATTTDWERAFGRAAYAFAAAPKG